MLPFKEKRAPKVPEKITQAPAWFKNELEKFARPGTNEQEVFTRYAFRLCGGNKERAQDAMQNALIQALKNHQQFERGTNMGGWLSTIIKNGLKSDYKKQQVRMRNDDDVQTSWIDATENPFLAIEESVSRTRRAERIAKMSAETQRAILAVYRLGSFKAAAAELGTSIANVKELLEKVNDQLSAVEGGHPTAQAAPRQREIIDDFLSEKDLETYLPQLTEQQRTVYTAVVINGKSYGEAAEIFRVAEGTIKSSLSRARSRLAEFKGIEIDMSTHTERLRSWFRDNPKTFREAVKGLPSYLQRVANLLIVESKSPTEIASLLKLPINTVKSQRHSLYQSLSNR